MRPRAKFGSFALGLGASAAVVALLGLARLTHQFPAAAASPGLLTPFLLPVLALALEAGALVALSLALFGTLVSAAPAPWLGRARATLPLLAPFALALALAGRVPRGTEHPGAFANALVQSARGSCGSSGKVPVPLLGLSVRCAAPRRLEGPMPGARNVSLAMDALTFSDDLRRVEISALELTASGSLRVRLRAGAARVSGLAPWSRSSRLSALGRFGVLAGLGLGLWALASALRLVGARPDITAKPASVREARLWRAVGAALFGLPGVAAAAAVISLDQSQAAPASYVLAWLAGALTLAPLPILLGRVPQILNSFREF